MNTNTQAKLFARFAGVVLIASAFWGAKTFADEPPVPSEVVKFQDLNLNESAGIAALYQRIHAASRRVCGSQDFSQKDLAERSREFRCARDAESKAVNDMHDNALTAYYQKKQGLASAVIVARNNAK